MTTSTGKVITLGEALIDFVPARKGCALKDVDQFYRAPGGAPANVAAAVAMLGGQASFIGKVGNDGFGDFLIEVLQTKGVNTEFVLKTNEAKTALAFVSLRENGERDFAFYRDPSADMLLKENEIKEEWFGEKDIYHFGSISLIQEPSRSATIKGISVARQKGCLISFDPNVRLPLWPDSETAKQTILKFIPYAHILKISEEELTFLTGILEEQQAVDQLFTGNIQLIIVTKGEEGCTYFTKDNFGAVESHEVKAEDTTGAGDAFVGGLLFQLNREGVTLSTLGQLLNNRKKVEDILYFANICGAITTQRPGAITALPGLQEVMKVISDINERGTRQ